MATKQGHESLDEAIRAGLKDRRQPAEVSITLGERSERGHRHGDQRDATRARDRAEAPKLLEARWRSSMVSPGRRPWSRSACRTQRRNVSAAPDLLGDRHDRRPLRVVLLLILQHHPHRALPDFRREPAESRHAPILSRSGASEKPGAIHFAAADLAFALKGIVPKFKKAYDAGPGLDGNLSQQVASGGVGRRPVRGKREFHRRSHQAGRDHPLDPCALRPESHRARHEKGSRAASGVIAGLQGRIAPIKGAQVAALFKCQLP